VAGGFLGYLVGVLFSLYKGADVSRTGFTMGYLIVLFEDLATHFNNDYYDVEVDRQAPFKPFGSVNLFIEQPELMDSAFLAAVGFSALSLLFASAMVLMGSNRDLLVVVVLFNILGWLYSAPPVRLHSRRLGEITIAIGTGFCIPAVGYIVAQGRIDSVFTMFSVPLVLYGFILSLSLQVPDYEVDRAMNKNTVVGLIGRKKTYFVVLLSAIAASGTYFLLFPNVTAYISMVSWVSLVPFASSLASVLFLSDSPEHARLFTKLNISALFLFLVTLDILFLMSICLM
jgi:1,4-dihydroxy-2-naphthoate octaprenyltransferase